MNLLVNGEPKQFSGKNISDLVGSLNMVSTRGIALAVNQAVISRAEWERFELKENDKVIIIKATQGG